MRRILILLFSFHSTLAVAQNVNHSQVLTDMLMQDKCFQAWDYKHLYGDSIVKETELIYNYKMSGFLNRPDSSAIYLERIFEECPAIMPDELTKLVFLNFLIGLYNETENYEKLVDVYDRAERLILTTSLGNNDIWKKEQLKLLNMFLMEAKSKLSNSKRNVFRYGYDENIMAIKKEPLVSSYNSI